MSLMGIKEFSQRTGISKSALRFYETKELLTPMKKNAKGYRFYCQEQVKEARMIANLRLAEVPLENIKQWQGIQEPSRREDYLDSLLQTIQKRVKILENSIRFLKGDFQDVSLIEKAPDTILWYKETANVGKFGPLFRERLREFQKLDVPVHALYLKYISGESLVHAHIGFGIQACTGIDIPHNVNVETMQGGLCIALPVSIAEEQIKQHYNQLLEYASQNQWYPAGPIIEWYRGQSFSQHDLLLPVVNWRGENEG
ncbi:MerR family transcriptional regulator [Rossellomorea marisflavi]|uniref:MerR family transcriptional regulator n=1 Tax=Rossellomorea marisflavi TaxID=189381 RepID=UPI003D2E1613